MKKRIGRPRKTLNDLPENWQHIIIDNMTVGASLQEIKTGLGISSDLFYRLMKDESEFSDTIKKGRELSEAWWLKQGRINLGNPKFNYKLWYQNMKNRFGWSDKQEISNRNKFDADKYGAIIF